MLISIAFQVHQPLEPVPDLPIALILLISLTFPKQKIRDNSSGIRAGIRDTCENDN